MSAPRPRVEGSRGLWPEMSIRPILPGKGIVAAAAHRINSMPYVLRRGAGHRDVPGAVLVAGRAEPKFSS